MTNRAKDDPISIPFLGVCDSVDQATQEHNVSNAGAVLKQFYDAVQRRDMRAARRHLDDKMTFIGLFETYPTADAYIATFTQLMQIVSRLDVKTIIGEGDSAAVFMEMETTAPAPGVTLVAEWHETKNGKIVRARSAFDGRPFAAMFAGAQDVKADELAIRALKEVFRKALLNRDAKLRASIWAEDGTVVPPQGGLFQGRAAIEKHFATEAQSITADSGAALSNYRFRFVNRDTAFVDVDLALSNVVGPDGKVHADVPISVSFTAVRQGAAWRIQDERASFKPMP